MTKGKHTQAAAVRHEVQSRDAEIETYRNAVARLTRELNEAREHLRIEQQRNRKAERELYARLELAADPRVEAQALIIGKLTGERDGIRAGWRKANDEMKKAKFRLVRHFVDHHAMTPVEALEAALGIFDVEKTVAAVARLESVSKIGVDGLRAVERARGQRR